MKITANRYHDFSYGHRVVGHEGKCRHLHGHNGRVHFYCEAKELDNIGRVIDFSVIKEKLCMWVEENWDHKFLAAYNDSIMKAIYYEPTIELGFSDCQDLQQSIIWLGFNPTAENLADYLLNTIGPQQLKSTEVKLVKVIFEETRKCSVTCSLKD